MTNQHPLAQVGYILAWLLITVLATATAWQLHITLISLASLLIDHPTLRPTGWSTSTLVPVGRLSIFIWGSTWLIFVMYAEYQLREALRERRLIQQCIRFATILIVLFGISYLFVSFVG